MSRNGANKSMSQAVRRSADKMLRHLTPRDNQNPEPLFAVRDMFKELTLYWDEIHGEGPNRDEEWVEKYLLPRQPPDGEPILPDIRGSHVRDQLKQMKVHTARGWTDGLSRNFEPSPKLLMSNLGLSS